MDFHKKAVNGSARQYFKRFIRTSYNTDIPLALRADTEQLLSNYFIEE